MMRCLFAPLFALALAACAGGGAALPGARAPGSTVPPGKVLLGAYLDKVSLGSFEQGLGRQLDIDNHYGSIVAFDFTQVTADLASGVTPMLSLSAWCDRANSVPCKWADTAAGKYDADLKAVGASIAALKVPVLVRIMYEAPTGNPSEQAAGAPDYSVSDFQNAFNHVCSVYRAAGASSIKCIFNSSKLAYVPSDADILSVDTYNKTTTAEPFQDFGFCAKAAALGKPLMITESGAGQAEQAEWLSTVKVACPKLFGFVYWSAPGAQNYVIQAPASFAALKAIGN